LRQRKAADKVQQAARKVREQEDAKRQAYDRYRRSEAVDIFAALPKSEQGIIKGLAQTHAAMGKSSSHSSNGSPATWPENTVGFDRSGCGF